MARVAVSDALAGEAVAGGGRFPGGGLSGASTR
jgi:hypothetical protein